MPLASVSAATLAAFKIGCLVTAWNSYNLNYLKIEYGFIENNNPTEVLPEPSESLSAYLEVNGYSKASALATLVFTAIHHADNIAKLNAAVEAAGQCALPSADPGWTPVVMDMALGVTTAAKGVVGLDKSGMDTPNPNYEYTAAGAGTPGRDTLSIPKECGVLLYGDDGNDEIQGTKCDDIIMGGKGIDVLDGGEGDNLLIGGRGDDTYHLSPNSRNIIADLGAGSDYNTVIVDSVSTDVELSTLKDSSGDLVLHFRSTGKNTLIAGTLGEQTINTIDEIQFKDGVSKYPEDLGGKLPVIEPLDIPSSSAAPLWEVVNSNNLGNTKTSGNQLLQVEILKPSGKILQSDSFVLSGRVTIGAQPSPETSIVYVIDLSRSTEADGNDCNSDGIVDAKDDYAVNDPGTGTVLDCEIAAVLAINEGFGSNDNVSVGIVGFESGVLGEYTMDPVSPPNVDSDNNSQTDVNEFLTTLARKPVFGWGGTDFGSALTRARQMLRKANTAKKRIYFFTDGITKTPATSQAQQAANEGIVIDTFSIGTEAEGCEGTEIGEIAKLTGGECRSVPNASEITAKVDEVILPPAATLDRVQVSINGNVTQTVSVNAAGRWKMEITPDQLGDDTNVISVMAIASDASSAKAEVRLNPEKSKAISDDNTTSNAGAQGSVAGDSQTKQKSGTGGGGAMLWLLALIYILKDRRLLAFMRRLNSN